LFYFWFLDKSRDFAVGICHWHPYGAFGNSQTKKKTNASSGRFGFPFQPDHEICLRRDKISASFPEETSIERQESLSAVIESREHKCLPLKKSTGIPVFRFDLIRTQKRFIIDIQFDFIRRSQRKPFFSILQPEENPSILSGRCTSRLEDLHLDLLDLALEIPPFFIAIRFFSQLFSLAVGNRKSE
jgi:hypothetical protein